MNFGTQKEVTAIDDSGSTLTVIQKVRNGEVAKTYKQYKIRVKVHDSKEEMAEYLKHTDSIKEKKSSGLLLLKDEDPTLLPSFVLEFPKFDQDGTYFVCKTWTEWVQ